MMGSTHSATGLLAGLLTLPYAPVTGVVSSVGWVAAWGGAALLPDMDTGASTAARLWGPLTAVPSRAVGVLARGHRAGTHDVLVAPVVAAAVTAVALVHPVAAGVVLALFTGLALVALDPVLPGDQGRKFGNLAVAVAAGWWLASSAVSVGWLPLAAAGGVVVHILGDSLTSNGVPVPLASWRPGRSGSWGPRLFTTGAPVETVVAGGVWAAALFATWLVVPHSLPTVDGSFPVEQVLAQVRGWVVSAWESVPTPTLVPAG